jgi:hypothetical protein
MGLPSHFLEKKFVKDEKGDDITPFDGRFLGERGMGLRLLADACQEEFQIYYRTEQIKIFNNPRCTFLQTYNVHCNTYILSPI